MDRIIKTESRLQSFQLQINSQTKPNLNVAAESSHDFKETLSSSWLPYRNSLPNQMYQGGQSDGSVPVLKVIALQQIFTDKEKDKNVSTSF